MTETVSWGILYYAFGILLTPMESELGWSRAQSSGAFSLGLMAAALGAVPAGRWVDRGGGRVMMTLGSCVATVLVLAWARVESLAALYAVWVAIGIAMAAVLYEPAFAVLAKWFVHDRDRGFTILTLVAGLASTIFNPITSWLAAHLGWRRAVMALAMVLAVTTIPTHALLLRGQPAEAAPGAVPRRRQVGDVSAPARDPVDADARTAMRTPTFWLLALAFVIQSFVHAGFILHAVVLLVERGHTVAFAATASGMIGGLQVFGRLVFAPLKTRLSQRTVTMLVFALQAVSLLALRVIPGVPGVVAFVVCFGVGNGMTTLMRASIVADLYGRTHYGSIAGVLALCSTGARAVAPVTVGLLYEAWRGYSPILVLLAALSLIAVVAAGLARRPARTAAPAP